MSVVIEAAALDQRSQLLSNRLVVAAIGPPISVSPHATVRVVERVSGIDRGGCPPVGVLVDQPSARAQAPRHLRDRLLLSADQMKERQARADEIERARAEEPEA